MDRSLFTLVESLWLPENLPFLSVKVASPLLARPRAWNSCLSCSASAADLLSTYWPGN